MNFTQRLLVWCAALLFLAPAVAVAGRHHPLKSSCDDPDSDDPLARAIQSLAETSGTERWFDEVRLTGLRTIDEDTLWTKLGGRPSGPVSSRHAATLLTRLFRSGLFATVAPKVDAPEPPGDSEDSHPVLELSLVEYPVLKQVTWQDLTEVQASELLPALVRDLGLGTQASSDDGDTDDEDACTPLELRREWVARMEHGQLQSGILVDGVSRGLDRVLEQLHDNGYVLASLTADLDAEGALVVHVDEGRLGAVEVRGVDPALEPRLRADLGLEPGKVFLIGDLESGLERVGQQYPFLSTHLRERALHVWTHVVSEGDGNGGQHYKTVPRTSRESDSDAITITARAGKRRTHWHLDGHLGRDNEEQTSIHLEGGQLVIPFTFEPVQNSFDWTELLHHSQVTSFAPGLGMTLRLQDPADRVSLSTQLAANLNTGSPLHPLDWIVGPKIQIPGLHIAELGLHLYSLDDTEDRWRVANPDSYLNSLLFNRPERDYFRRSGADAFLTFWAKEQLVLGVEYRNDVYQSLPDATHYYTLFYRREPQFPNAPVTEGRMGSALFRLEWSTESATMQDFNSRYRAPTQSIVERHFEDDIKSGFTTVNTVELGNRALGSDPGLQFVRVVSDNVLQVRTAEEQGFRLRLRGAGGNHLPIQKEEALGGWSALRGYDYKEFVGDYSVLGSAEYRWGVLSGFADVGTVHQVTGWTGPKLGLGVGFNVGQFSLEAAWRADDRARLIPEFRLVIRDLF